MPNPVQSEISIHSPSDVTAKWLAGALGTGSISTFSFSRVGSGQMSDCFRFKLEYPRGPASAILKVAAQDSLSRHTGDSLGLYHREVLFYQQIAPLFSGVVPHAYFASHDAVRGSFALLLNDSRAANNGDDITGATLEQSRSCLKVLGHIHGTMLRQGVGNYSWLKREQPMNQALFQSLFDGFVSRYRDILTVEQLTVCSRLVGCYDAYKQQQGEVCVPGMIHGDFRLDNILFGADAHDLVVVDWQTVQWGPVLGDLAYFLGGSLSQELRRAHFEELLQVYYNSLGTGTPLTLERCLSDLRHESFFGLVMLITSCMMVKETERGDVLFTTMIKRHCDFVLDLDAVAVLPSCTPQAVLQPLPEDESLHPQGEETLYNESYYFDFVDPEQGLAGYVRLGITPNVANGGWYLAVVSRRGKPLVSVTDYAAPSADETLRICGQGYEAGHQVIEPLKVFQVTLKAKANIYTDESSVFKNHSSEGTAELSLNLTFHTDGTPYKYRVATRYEIPCLVNGTVSVDGETCTISRQAGQRDHSWGVRNWWNMDWFWGGIHLNDGELDCDILHPTMLKGRNRDAHTYNRLVYLWTESNGHRLLPGSGCGGAGAECHQHRMGHRGGQQSGYGINTSFHPIRQGETSNKGRCSWPWPTAP